MSSWSCLSSRCFSAAIARAAAARRAAPAAVGSWTLTGVIIRGAGVVHRGRQSASNLRVRHQVSLEHRQRGPSPARRGETALGSGARQANKQRHRRNRLCQQGIDAGRSGANAGQCRRARSAPHPAATRQYVYPVIGGMNSECTPRALSKDNMCAGRRRPAMLPFVCAITPPPEGIPRPVTDPSSV